MEIFLLQTKFCYRSLQGHKLSDNKIAFFSLHGIQRTRVSLANVCLVVSFSMFSIVPSSVAAQNIDEYARFMHDQQISDMARLLHAEQEISIERTLIEAQRSGANEGELREQERQLRLEAELSRDSESGRQTFDAAREKVAEQTFSIVKDTFFNSSLPTTTCGADRCLEVWSYVDGYGETQSVERSTEEGGQQVYYRQFCSTYGDNVRQCFNVDTQEMLKQRRSGEDAEWRNSLD